MDGRKQLVLDGTGAQRVRSLRDNWRTSRCFPPITFRSPDEEIKHLESVLTIVGGKPVYAAEEFAELAPPLPPVLPEWSPVAAYGGYAKPALRPAAGALDRARRACACHDRCKQQSGGGIRLPLLGVLGRSQCGKEYPSIHETIPR